MIWNTDYETLGAAAMARLQGERLGRLVDVLYRRVPFYREKMDALRRAAAGHPGHPRHRPAARSPPRTRCGTSTPTGCSPWT